MAGKLQTTSNKAYLYYVTFVYDPVYYPCRIIDRFYNNITIWRARSIFSKVINFYLPLKCIGMYG